MKLPWVSRAKLEAAELDRDWWKGEAASERADADGFSADYRALSAEFAALQAKLSRFSANKPRDSKGHFLKGKEKA